MPLARLHVHVIVQVGHEAQLEDHGEDLEEHYRNPPPVHPTHSHILRHGPERVCYRAEPLESTTTESPSRWSSGYICTAPWTERIRSSRADCLARS